MGPGSAFAVLSLSELDDEGQIVASRDLILSGTARADKYDAWLSEDGTIRVVSDWHDAETGRYLLRFFSVRPDTLEVLQDELLDELPHRVYNSSRVSGYDHEGQPHIVWLRQDAYEGPNVGFHAICPL